MHKFLYPSRDLSMKNRFLDSGFIVYMAAGVFCDLNMFIQH